MIKAVKKKNRKLKRQVRKTLGALLMATSIAVAAVPVPDVSATIEENPKRVAVVNYTDSTMNTYEPVDSRQAPQAWQSKVPFIDADEPIYSTGDGMYQFAFVAPAGGGTEIAVILRAEITKLPDGKLDIPDEIDGYRKYIANSSYTGFVAVSKNNKYLYYKRRTQRISENGGRVFIVPALSDRVVTEFTPGMEEQKDGTFLFIVETTGSDGVVTKTEYATTPVYDESFRPCAYLEYDEWKDFEDYELYYWDSSKGPNPEYKPNAYLDEIEVPADTFYIMETPEPVASPSPSMFPMLEDTVEPADKIEIAPPNPTASNIEGDNGISIAPEQTSLPTPTAILLPTAEPSEAPVAATPTTEPADAPTATPTTEPKESIDELDSIQQEPEEENYGEIIGKTVESGLKVETFEKTLDTVMADNLKNASTVALSVMPRDAAVDNPNEPQYFYLASQPEYYRLRNATVQYIGRQYLRRDPSGSNWHVAGVVNSSNPKDGVFADKAQIHHITIGDSMLGIGDYAFYGCAGIESVSLNNGLNTIGNAAFARCTNMTSFNMIPRSEIKSFGKDAFMQCEALTTFTVPINVEAIGDYCFQGCKRLTKIELMPEGLNPSIKVIGYNAFEGCASLASMDFPEGFKQEYPLGNDWKTIRDDENGKIPISYFKGCTSLQNITIRNSSLDIVDGVVKNGEEGDHDQFETETGCSIKNFLKTVPDSFYFEGPDLVMGVAELSPIHQTAKEHLAAFKYLGEDRFEKVVRCPEDDQHPSTFIVNSKNQLIEMELDSDCTVIQIPEKIGQYGVSTISASSFRDNCRIKKIYIPASVNLIETDAFKGCHNLEAVIFTQPENSNLVIQDRAFNTQDVSYHQTDCPTNGKIDDIPELTFTGTVSESSAPFKYAMNPKNNINVGGQQANTYITYYSGWPTNLTVKYNWQTGKNELLDYPRYDEIGQYTLDSFPYMTDEYVKAAVDAMRAYNDYLSDNKNVPTQDQLDIVNSALNINLPDGIEAIAEGIFSGVDTAGNAMGGAVPAPSMSPDPAASSIPAPAPGALKVNEHINSITMHTVETVDPYAFAGCPELTGVYMAGGNKIDNYAFKNCSSLANVEIAPSVAELGLRPFAGCDKLQDVKFEESTNFTCENQIIFGLTDGAKTKIVECLEARGETVGSPQIGPEGLETITELAEEAFKDCDGIGSVDLTASSISTVPREAFSRTGRIYSVKLPTTTKSIRDGAFWNSNISYLEIPSSVTLIENEAFADVIEEKGEIKLDDKGRPEIDHVNEGHRPVTFYCTEGDAADTYADAYYYINPTYFKPLIMHEVRFWDYPKYPDRTPALYHKTEVEDGKAAVPPEDPTVEGYAFVGWSADFSNVVRDMDLYANYSDNVYTVTFTDSQTGEILKTEKVGAGKSATAPEPPEHEGFTFDKWSRDYTNVTADIIVSALYKDNSGSASRHKVVFYDNDGTVLDTQMVDHEGKARPPMPPTKPGYTFIRWIPSDFSKVVEDMNIVAYYEPGGGPLPSGYPQPSGQPGTQPTSKPKGSPGPTATPTATPANGDNVVKYTVSVSGGSGSGSYPAGAIVAINAYYRGEGQVFDRWTSSTAGVGFANPNASSTTFTMPAANVAVTATYKTGSGSAGGSGSGGSGGGGTGGSGGSTGSSNNGTVVEVTKPGISNTNLAGATVTGATDNFVVKVTEDQMATDAVIAALQARYGDISRIQYLPMDISLYDSTGRIKIADTSGISVNLTLPLPDGLIQYAGNNRVAAVANGGLEDLNTRFTTVGGVPCVNFTATHFSPYVIYVDTANLTEATIDATPKTGDPIHPKWFLALGLACTSLILFFKRDKKMVLNTKKA